MYSETSEKKDVPCSVRTQTRMKMVCDFGIKTVGR